MSYLKRMTYLKPAFLLVTAILFLAMSVADSDARGHKGSHRVGGHSSHGKGSHYVGGR